MTKILIVDDEMLARIGLTSLIEWENYNMQVVGQAENGKIAYEMAMKLQPDIIITDIKMPLMNGVQLIKKLKTNGFLGEFIVFSGFNDYEYVKEAMKAGAKDYILKLKLDKEELIEVLQNIITEKNQSNDNLHMTSKKMESLIQNNIPILKREIIKKILTGEYESIEKIKNKCVELEVDLSRKQFVCVSLRLGSWELEKKYGDTESHLLDSSIINIILNCIPLNANYHLVNMQSRNYILLFSFDDVYQEQLNHWIRIIKNEFDKYLNVNVIFGISNPYTELSNIKVAYKESQKASEQVVGFGGKYSIYYKDVVVTNDFLKPLENILKTFEKAYVEKSEEDIQHSLDQLILEFKNIKSMSRKQLQIICIHIIYIIRVNEQITQISIEDIWDSAKSYNSFESFFLIEDYISWIQQVQTKLINHLQKFGHDYLLIRARKYIHKYFQDQEISLTKLADNLNVSPNYLSSIFKKELNMNYNEYLTECRIEEAKVKLRSTDKKIYIIAEEVGYGNIHYFSRIFKKITGISPIHYRNNSHTN